MTAVDRTQNTNADIARALREGTAEGFALFYEAFAHRLMAFVTRSLRDASAASDIVHESLISARTHISQLRDDEHLAAWVYAITRNEMRAHARRNSRTIPTSQIPDRLTDTDFSGMIERRELIALLGAAVSGLSAREQRVYMLYTQSGLSAEQIADLLDVSVANARKLLQRVRRHVAQSMEALVLAQPGCSECPEFQTVLAGWDGNLSPLWRKRIARHVDTCSGCEQQRESVIAMVPNFGTKKVSIDRRSPTLSV